MNWRFSRRQALALGGVASIASLLAGCGAAQPRAGLYVTSSEGAPRWIDDTTGAPAWSPDGEAVAWGDERGLRIWNVSTGDVSHPAATPLVGKAAWSPDSAAVAYLDSQAQVLQRLDFASGITTPLATLHSGFDGAVRVPIMSRGGPEWSPDGSRIAFVCWDGYGDELCIVNADGSDRQQLTTLGIAEERTGGAARSSVTGFAWSPDSAMLAVSVQAEVRGAAAGVFRVDLASRSGQRLSTMAANSPLIWEAATDDLLVSSSIEGRPDVYRLPAQGGNPVPITSDLAEGAREPAIDASGTLAVVSGRQIAVLPPGSGDVTFYEETGLTGGAPDFSADGSHLAFLALARPIERYP